MPDLPLEPLNYRSNFAKDLFTIAKPHEEVVDDKDEGAKDNLEKRAKVNNVVSDDRDPRDRIESPDFHEHDDHAKDDKHGWSSKVNSGDHQGDHHDKDVHGDHIKNEETEFPEEMERKPPGQLKDNKQRKPGIKSYSTLGGDHDYDDGRAYRGGYGGRGYGGRGYGGGRRRRGRGGDRYGNYQIVYLTLLITKISFIGYNNNYRNRGRDDYSE